VRLVWRWGTIERELPPNWQEARLVLRVREHEAARAASLLGGAGPLRRGDAIQLFVSRTGGVGADAVRRALLRLDRAGIAGTLELAAATESEAPPVAAPPPSTLAAQWDAAVAGLPEDWSDLLAEVVLRSSDQLERAALLASPLNPLRVGERLALRFRVARRFGYGTSKGMARRCFERLDEEGIPGRLEIQRVLADTDPVGTQGPVWRVGGRAV
jgi:hypothetical protein